MLLITIFIVLFSLILLTALHELGHFLFAKKFEMKVEEFGVGYPPRVIGKKIKGTLYSLNLLPFGAFVKIKGEDGSKDGEAKLNDSFTSKPIWQRAIVLFAGVAVFWVVAFLIFTIVAGIFGIPSPVPDTTEMPGAKVQIIAVMADSPAQRAGLKPGDTILSLKTEEIELKKTNKTNEVQEFILEAGEKEISFVIERNNEQIETKVTPKQVADLGRVGVGVSLVRVAEIKTVWYKAPLEGLVLTGRLTKAIPLNLYLALKTKITGGKTSGIEIVGPIGFGKMLGQSFESGLGNFLVLMGMIAIWLALFNLFPIPALDGGRLLFLGIEAVRRKPMNQKVEQSINTYFFLALIGLMVLLSIKDIINLF
ncbi:hypothetical protein COU05_01750 [bacterium (Candidatus Gribaldobacteria) CG10_big_fil_rev_8_21_14_0_10_37_21]|uniref:PDZ domain-containing protein n=1 Tax=bacterium (Candidatus Gribaldobacteria) CG10_big_fil_rev_8_21_14_0_10_37_21 TaxID=2014275 RepID=A0A2H0UUJ6_9BACT|nr:MAG: hypothetical protein AUJ25_03260 [Parcubacteria group bacterium CG1_02_37_13]PIR90488.1 MAG: hypothetical protein COU05_01750 [bacterium (Candidatus Gribaldobacteria) CG10_big_fil_rev_8_21_14_0_10_37_21]